MGAWGARRQGLVRLLLLLARVAPVLSRSSLLFLLLLLLLLLLFSWCCSCSCSCVLALVLVLCFSFLSVFPLRFFPSSCPRPCHFLLFPRRSPSPSVSFLVLVLFRHAALKRMNAHEKIHSTTDTPAPSPSGETMAQLLLGTQDAEEEPATVRVHRTLRGCVDHAFSARQHSSSSSSSSAAPIAVVLCRVLDDADGGSGGRGKEGKREREDAGLLQA
eukprot:3762783-Rhodomonas_salina.1